MNMLDLAAEMNLTITKHFNGNYTGGNIVRYVVWSEGGSQLFSTVHHALLMDWLRKMAA